MYQVSINSSPHTRGPWAADVMDPSSRREVRMDVGAWEAAAAAALSKPGIGHAAPGRCRALSASKLRMRRRKRLCRTLVKRRRSVVYGRRVQLLWTCRWCGDTIPKGDGGRSRAPERCCARSACLSTRAVGAHDVGWRSRGKAGGAAALAEKPDVD
jgi:hypothetical protein